MTWHPEIPEEYRNQIVTGDAQELTKRIPDESVDLIIADPPYYKIADEEWDHQWASIEEWADWCLSWGREANRVLASNGSIYIYGDNQNLAYIQVRFDKLNWGLLNLIIWSKTNYTMLKASPDALRSYQVQAEEHILFYGKDKLPGFGTVASQQAATPMGVYLKSERDRANVTMKEIQELFPSKTGGLTGCVSNWELGLNFPLPEQYETIRVYLNNKNGNEYLRKEYEELRKEYEELRKEYEELRRPFFGGNFTDVWKGPLISGLQKTHISEKPAWINKRMILASSRPHDVVLDLFCGSGSLIEWCKKYGRNYIAFEIDPDTAELARERVRNTQPPLFVLEPEQLELKETDRQE